MFQAIVHAPALRDGVRLCVSDLDQSYAHAPAMLRSGDGVALRFGTCCPRLDTGEVALVTADAMILRVANHRWRLKRCPQRGGIDLPGLVAEDWFIVGKADRDA